MSIKSEIVKLFTDLGVELEDDLRDSLQDVLKKHGRKNPNVTSLHFDHKIIIDESGGVTLNIVSDEYWKFIESGRRPGAKRLPADVVGKVWQNQNNIDARKVLLSIRAKNNKGLKVKSNKLNYEKAARSLSFVIQKSIFKKGIPPKPFVDGVIKDGRMDVFKSKLIPLLGKHFKLEIKGLE